jgi:hypothetical protein
MAKAWPPNARASIGRAMTWIVCPFRASGTGCSQPWWMRAEAQMAFSSTIADCMSSREYGFTR